MKVNYNGAALIYISPTLICLPNWRQSILKGFDRIKFGSDNDLVVNPMKAKQLTNIRAAGNDENLVLTPPLRFDLEQALAFITEDELVEVTPQAIRLRKRMLKEVDRRRIQRQSSN